MILLFHSIVYISVVYVWDKVEPVHCELFTLKSLWKCMHSVIIMRVLKVLVCTAACNNSCVAVGTYIYVNNNINMPPYSSYKGPLIVRSAYHVHDCQNNI